MAWSSNGRRLRCCGRRAWCSLSRNGFEGRSCPGRSNPASGSSRSQLTDRFQISRAPLREALRLLIEQGLVEHVPRRGARVTTYSGRDFDDLFAIRDALERLALSLVRNRRPEELDLGAVQLALGTLRDAAGRGDGLAASNAHRGFHLALVGLAGSRQLLATYEPVIVKLRLYMAANLRREADAGSPAEGVRRHQRLLDAVLSRDPVRVGEELDRHGSRQYFH